MKTNRLEKRVAQIRKCASLAFSILVRPKLWSAFSVKSHLTYEERLRLYRLALRARTIVEIGSYVGASSCCFGAAARSHRVAGAQIICVDTWNNDAMTEGGRDTWAAFQKNTSHIVDLIKPVRGFSAEVLNQVREVTDIADLLFVDGDHSYEGVKSDWEAYKSLVRSGTIVVFHDYGWAEGVKRVIREDVAPRVSECGALPNLWWGKIA